MLIKTDNKKFADSLISNVPEKIGKEKELDKRIQEHLRKHGSIQEVEGIYGDSNYGCSAYIESVIKGTGGGTFYKLYGCCYLYQGGLDREITDRVAIVKRALFEIARLIYKNPIILLTLRIKEIISLVERIYMADLEKYQLPDKEFSRAMRELIRVGLKFAPPKVVYCFAMIFEFDNAYFQRLRDALCLFKSRLYIEKDIRNEVNWVLNVIIDREKDGKREGGGDLMIKYRMFKMFLSIGLLISNKLRNLVKSFILELDLNKIDFDEADWFFCLNRRGYDFRGISFEERYKEYLKESE